MADQQQQPQKEKANKDLTDEEKKKKKEDKAKQKEERREQAKAQLKEKKKAEKEAKKAEATTAPPAEKQQAQQKSKGGENKEGIEFKKEKENFADWYTQCITKSEMIEYYDISGCYILRPWSFQIWDAIRDFVDGEIKKLGVQNSYFPMFVKKKWLEMEKDHLEGFSPEVAWVTHSGDTPMAEPMAVRPTSETIMYPAYGNWIRSHRDLPLKLNQWCNVVRWEFKYPVPFIRSREFLWQEGHTAFATLPEAEEEVMQILDIYRRVYEELLAVPVTPGKKTENEKFAGGHYTTTVEAFVPTVGRAVQGATSHCLGQNFSKMFNIRYECEDPSKGMQYVWQNSWGLTTRTIGVMVMVHGDNDGLVLPPRVAPIQVAIVPLYYKDVANEVLNKKADEIAAALKAVGIRVTVDKRDQKKPGWKYAHWELKGVPVRLELGPKDLTANTIVAARRDNRAKQTFAIDTAAQQVKQLLDSIQADMLANARNVLDSRVKKLTNWVDFVPTLDQGNIVLAPFCLEKACEENLKARSAEEAKKLAAEKSANQEDPQKSLTSAAKSLCIPFNQPELPQGTTCFCCGAAAQKWTLFGRSY